MRWLILLSLVGGLATRDRLQAILLKTLVYATSLQFLLGLGMSWGYLKGFWSNPSAGIRVQDLRFFGMEHPIGMFFALGLIHAGCAKLRRGEEKGKVLLGISLLLTLAVIPWWRPMLRI